MKRTVSYVLIRLQAQKPNSYFTIITKQCLPKDSRFAAEMHNKKCLSSTCKEQCYEQTEANSFLVYHE